MPTKNAKRTNLGMFAFNHYLHSLPETNITNIAPANGRLQYLPVSVFVRISFFLSVCIWGVRHPEPSTCQYRHHPVQIPEFWVLAHATVKHTRPERSPLPDEILGFQDSRIRQMTREKNFGVVGCSYFCKLKGENLSPTTTKVQRKPKSIVL